MAVVGQMTHVRCKVMYRCGCARHCTVETDTQQGYQQKVLKKQTWDPTLSNTIHVTVARRQACNQQTQQQCNLRLTHLQCSQFTWSRNQGRVTSSHVADSVTFAERECEIPSPDHGQGYTGVVNVVLRHSIALYFHQQVQTSVIPLYAHPDSHFAMLQKYVLNKLYQNKPNGPSPHVHNNRTTQCSQQHCGW